MEIHVKIFDFCILHISGYQLRLQFGSYMEYLIPTYSAYSAHFGAFLHSDLITKSLASVSGFQYDFICSGLLSGYRVYTVLTEEASLYCFVCRLYHVRK